MCVCVRVKVYNNKIHLWWGRGLSLIGHRVLLMYQPTSTCQVLLQGPRQDTQNGAKPEKPRLCGIKDYLSVWETQCTVTQKARSHLQSTIIIILFGFVVQLMRYNYLENKNYNNNIINQMDSTDDFFVSFLLICFDCILN